MIVIKGYHRTIFFKKYLMLQYKMTQYTDFVKAHMAKRKMSWNCAVCDIKAKKLYKPRVAPPKRSEPAKKSSDSEEFREFRREFNEHFLEFLNKLTPEELNEMARDAPRRGRGIRNATRKSKKSYRRNSRGTPFKSKK